MLSNNINKPSFLLSSKQISIKIPFTSNYKTLTSLPVLYSHQTGYSTYLHKKVHILNRLEHINHSLKTMDSIHTCCDLHELLTNVFIL